LQCCRSRSFNHFAKLPPSFLRSLNSFELVAKFEMKGWYRLMNGACSASTLEMGASAKAGSSGEDSSVGRESGRGEFLGVSVARRVDTVEVVRSARIGRSACGAGEGDSGGLVLGGSGDVV